MKIYSAIYNCFSPLQHFFPEAELVVVDHPSQLNGDGILIMHGGQDISPSLYNKKVSFYTGATENPSQRDLTEWALLEEAKKQKIPVFGICRGSQLLCAFNGGFLVQDVTGHEGMGMHPVTLKDGTTIQVNSLHHQMQYPFDVPHELLAHTHGLSTHYYDENKTINVPLEPEAIYYEENNSLAFQWHPEMLRFSHPSNQWIRETISSYWNL